MQSLIYIRNGTTEEWNTSEYILKIGELGLDTTTNIVKAGDGVSKWTALEPINSSSIPKLSATNGITIEDGGVITGINADESQPGVAKMYSAAACTTYTFDDGNLTPAAVKKAITDPSVAATFDATRSQPGRMSAADKAKLDGLATVATTGNYSDLKGTPAAYTLPEASQSVLGGVKMWRDGNTLYFG